MMPASSLPAEAQPGPHWTIPGRGTDDFQPSVRALPVPLLEETLAKYVRSCEPLLSASELMETNRIAGRFLVEEGPALQRQLERHAGACAAAGAHWLEAWWEHFAYFSQRDPLPCHSNFMSTLMDNSPASDRLGRGAKILHGFAEFAELLSSRRVAPDCLDTRGKQPLCMWQYSRLFATRTPGAAVDGLVPTNDARHAVVLCDGHAYWLRIRAEAAEGGAPLCAASIQRALDAIDRHAAARGPSAHPPSALTALPRHEWSEQRGAILRGEAGSGAGAPANAVALEQIESALVALTLDRATPDDAAALVRAIHLAGDGRSTWFDKSISLVLFANGTAGVQCEHGAFDSAVPARCFCYVGRRVAELERTDGMSPAGGSGGGGGGNAADGVRREAAVAAVAEWHPIELRLPRSVLGVIAERCPAHYAQLVATTTLCPVRFTGGGRLAAAALRGVASPDSLVQMAFQLAQMRDQGRLVATYEAATMRRFAHGRTETVRSCSVAAAAFVRAMQDPSASTAARQAALATALREHTGWLVACGAGRGIDRHLLGLRLIAATSGAPTPALFEDVAYTRSTHWALSTSNTSCPGRGGEYFDFGGFGTPMTDCYGISYQIQDRAISLTVCSDPRCQTRCARRFAACVLASLSDCYALVTPELRTLLAPSPAPSKAPPSKL